MDQYSSGLYHPRSQSFVFGDNVLFQTSGLASAFVAENEVIEYQLTKGEFLTESTDFLCYFNIFNFHSYFLVSEARRQELEVNIRRDGCNVIVT